MENCADITEDQKILELFADFVDTTCEIPCFFAGIAIHGIEDYEKLDYYSKQEVLESFADWYEYSFEPLLEGA